MEHRIYSVIVGSGSYIPTRKITNDYFLENTFYDRDGVKLEKMNAEIIQQFEKITGIKERRYVTDDLVTSDIAFFAAKEALLSSGTDPETLDLIIVAHNFGDLAADNKRSHLVPALSAKVKNHLGIRNPSAVAYDLPFGCAGWLQAVIQADIYIRSGNAQKALIIGAETLSRVCDLHDRDSMIYADGAGAIILEATKSDRPLGVIAHKAKSYADELAYVLQMGKSSNPQFYGSATFLKMNGRKLYENALKTVPLIIKECLDGAALSVADITKVLIHQANEKMDDAILKHLFELCGLKNSPKDIMPMTISWLGNSSVATLPTLYDLMCKGNFEKQVLESGNNIVFASVGAGVNMNAVIYTVP